jgi:SAM-dependent methyltransferase
MCKEHVEIQKSKRVSETNTRVYDLLRCPFCLSPVATDSYGAKCKRCHQRYGKDENGKIDFRLKRSKLVNLEVVLYKGFEGDYEKCFSTPLKKRHDFKDPSLNRLSKKLQWEIFPFFPKASGSHPTVLDVGCQNAVYRKPCEALGYHYIGTDIITSSELDFVCDAHALPFCNSGFDLVMANNLIEHIRYPMVAVKEFSRILKPNGLLVGVVSFLEPFHGDSMTHFTHLGTYNLLRFGGFRITSLTASPNWDVFSAFSVMGFIPKIPRPILNTALLPVKVLYNIAWALGILFNRPGDRRRIRRNFTKDGSFTFVEQKA